MLIRHTIAALLLGTAALQPAYAGVIASNLAGDHRAHDGPTYSMGQSFTVEGSGQFSDITLSFYSTPGGPEAPGTIYLYNSAFTGTNTQLGTGSGLLGSAIGVAGVYNFGSSIELTGSTKYYAYVASRNPGLLYDANNSYVGGEAYQAEAGTGFKFDAISFVDYTFNATGTPIAPSAGPVPEPATWMFMIGGLAMVGALMRRRVASSRFALKDGHTNFAV